MLQIAVLIALLDRKSMLKQPEEPTEIKLFNPFDALGHSKHEGQDQ